MLNKISKKRKVIKVINTPTAPQGEYRLNICNSCAEQLGCYRGQNEGCSQCKMYSPKAKRKNTNEPTCPYCDEILEEFETIDIELTENGLSALKLGKCPTCEKEFKYFEKYTYSSFEMLGEND